MSTIISNKTYQWLAKASEQWQNSTLISPSQRLEILALYQTDEKKGLLTSIVLMIAMLLIGGGIIMLVAHNWHQLNYLQRAITALLPVFLTQLGLLYTVIRFYKTTHLAKESLALLHGLSIGAAIALISQTYHLYGQLNQYFLIWSLLLLPITYIVRAHSLFLLMLMLFISSAVTGFELWSGIIKSSVFLYLGLMITMLPYLYYNRHQVSVFGWVIGFSILCFIILIDHVDDGNVFLYTCLYGGLLYMLSYVVASARLPTHAAAWLKMFNRPLKWVGGSILLAMMIYYVSIYFDSYYYRASYIDFHPITLACISCYTIAWLVFILSRGALNTRIGPILVAGFPCVLVVCTSLLLTDIVPSEQAEAFDLLALQQYALIAYLVIMSLQLISEAIDQQRWVKMNVALALLSYLLLTVFLLERFDLIYRGIAFILVGLLMVGVNLYILRRYKHAA